MSDAIDYTVFKSPLDDFRREAMARGLTTHVHYLDRGESFDFRLEELT